MGNFNMQMGQGYGNITITGGEVIATGGLAAIGSDNDGYHAANGTIKITGGVGAVWGFTALTVDDECMIVNTGGEMGIDYDVKETEAETYVMDGTHGGLGFRKEATDGYSLVSNEGEMITYAKLWHKHDWGEWKPEIEPDVDKEGLEKRICQNVNTHIQTRPLPPLVQVTFDVNGHGTAPDPQILNIGDKAQKPLDPQESGWVFDGWYTEKGCESCKQLYPVGQVDAALQSDIRR